MPDAKYRRKVAEKSPTKSAAAEPVARKRKAAKYKSLRLQKKIPHPSGPIPGAWKLAGMTKRLLWNNKKPVGALLLIYLFLNLALVQGFVSPLDVGEVKSQMQLLLGSEITKVQTTAAIFGQLIDGGSTESAPTAGTYQVLLLIIFGLATIWLFRQSSVGNKVTAKKALYQGMYPLIPLLLVLSMMVIETVPAIIATSIYKATVSSGIAVTGYEIAIWTLLSASLLFLTVYLLFSSMFALYIVTLPNMGPLKALRSSRQLVFSRRLSIFLRLLILPLILVLVLILIVVPTIYFAASIAPWVYIVLLVMGALFIHAYLFTLYKELL